jgi:hypothetical protein
MFAGVGVTIVAFDEEAGDGFATGAPVPKLTGAT